MSQLCRSTIYGTFLPHCVSLIVSSTFMPQICTLFESDLRRICLNGLSTMCQPFVGQIRLKYGRTLVDTLFHATESVPELALKWSLYVSASLSRVCPRWTTETQPVAHRWPIGFSKAHFSCRFLTLNVSSALSGRLIR